MQHGSGDAEDIAVRAAESLAFADAALALAGGEVTDPVLLEITERAALEEITSEEAVAEIRRHVLGR
ncbi:hypothetical protein [Clavibacter nebraskensis]|uniref:Antitoxin VbhA domain-containing protein n=2 Tax=Clavibacter nebraskensis TaxID=31963 RepID=A0A399PY81_9MICO|nr:hypothetical protein [Clavibacter nebraskensis]KXU19764.1 hypothetical protein VV38_12740 [Clavibacter nebraskensis]OAH17819.1 hypothetical protein A3Q38_13745 [Clavibacter nebraskensis]QGV67685.1 hypothetical protein EGX36_13130 [Clavibacter nebraskensis]QGV70485.1 hypothetical protein EGX37_13085 [Clavibacter nebraskensis]QGV73276.1 hypothetical protein EGX35_13085 [Clavibacter nebraskensis]